MITDIKDVTVRKVENGFTIEVTGTKDSNPYHRETRIAADLSALQAMLNELFASSQEA